MKKGVHGFTLIEVMVVVVIVSILAIIAYPSYQDSVRKSRRAECAGVLTTVANALERRYSVSNTYLDAAGLRTLPNGVPAVCPADGGAGQIYYNVQFPVGNANSFRVDAVPVGGQAADRCGTLTLDNTGQKGQAPGKTVEECWR